MYIQKETGWRNQVAACTLIKCSPQGRGGSNPLPVDSFWSGSMENGWSEEGREVLEAAHFPTSLEMPHEPKSEGVKTTLG